MELREAIEGKLKGIFGTEDEVVSSDFVCDNSRPTTNGSLFFITYVKQPHLNGLSFIFGRVTHGFVVLELMEKDPWIDLLQRSG
ncbi:hypothetical protein MRB53_020677 [Persea americana]|uniref:Uncharacterized protein n=1 Tax=Persea americana TaxID=3435 RepID=A0ACC2L227_PERAE|nr:hypothetical protein MRB53_020677 [Persea americana]